MPEFIFNTRHFRLCKGFVGFDLAFRSDNATVMSCAQDKGYTPFLWLKCYGEIAERIYLRIGMFQ